MGDLSRFITLRFWAVGYVSDIKTLVEIPVANIVHQVTEFSSSEVSKVDTVIWIWTHSTDNMPVSVVRNKLGELEEIESLKTVHKHNEAFLKRFMEEITELADCTAWSMVSIARVEEKFYLIYSGSEKQFRPLEFDLRAKTFHKLLFGVRLNYNDSSMFKLQDISHSSILVSAKGQLFMEMESRVYPIQIWKDVMLINMHESASVPLN